MRHSTRARTVAVAVAAAVAAGSCGTAPTVSSTAAPPGTLEIGACRSSEPRDQTTLWIDRIATSSKNWIEASNVASDGVRVDEERSGDGSFPTIVVTLDRPRDLTGDATTRLAHPQLVMPEDKYQQARQEMSGGDSLLVQVRFNGESSATASVTAIADGNGDLEFLGDCAAGNLTGPFREFAAYLAASGEPMTERDLLVRLIEEPDGHLVATAMDWIQGIRPLPDWDDLAPEERMILAGFTPADVMADLVATELWIDAPSEWLATGKNLCTRSSVAWSGTCSRLDPGRNDEGPLRVQAYSPAGEPIELVLKDGTALTSPYVTVATIEPSTFGTTGRVAVHLAGDPSIPDTVVVTVAAYTTIAGPDAPDSTAPPVTARR